VGRSSTAESLVRLLQPVVERTGLDLEDVTVTPAGKRKLLRVIVDKDGGVTLDDVADVSRTVSETLDSSDAMSGGAYVLEVTSPGVDRPLAHPRHWRRARGRLVVATLQAGPTLTGRVVDVGDGGVVLAVGGKEHSYAWGEIARARVEVEFSRGTPDGAADGSDGSDVEDGDHVGSDSSDDAAEEV
jgi:ribosome maturation factor RimP